MRHFITSLALLAVVGFATSAEARDIAALEVNIGSAVDANVRSDIEDAVQKGVEGSGKFSFISASTARRKINPVARDCYTADCLKKAGEDTGAAAGIRVRFSGEAQIYDWTIETYDLGTGKQVVSDKGACELCGRAEVQRTFQRSVTAAVTKTKIATPSASKPKPKPDPEPDRTPDPEPEPDVEPDTEVAQDQPANTGKTRLEISIQPADAEIFLGGQSIGTGDQSVDLEPGTYELRFAREGYQGFKESVLVGEQTSEVMTMRIHLSKTDPDPVIVQSGGGVVDKMSSSDRIVYGSIAAAAGGITIALGLFAASLDGDSACGSGSFEECPEIWDTDGVAITSAVVGTTLVLGGIGLLAWEFLAGGDEEVESDGDESQPEPTNDAEVEFAPAVGPGSLGVQMFGRF